MKLKIEVIYSRGVEKFLSKNSSVITREKVRNLVIKAAQKINGCNVDIDLVQLHGKLKGKYRIRKGNLRIIIQYFKGEIHIINIEEIGFRGDIYKK